MIAILVAVKQELRPILARAEASHIVRQAHLDFYEGTLAGKPVALLALGIGKECARIAAEMTIRCYRPDLIISAGFGGGLSPQVANGDIVIGTEALDESMAIIAASEVAMLLTPTGVVESCTALM